MGYYADCIVGCGSSLDENDLSAKAGGFLPENGTALVVYTSGIACFSWNDSWEPSCNARPGDAFDAAHVLDMRVFTESGEFHAQRSSMGKPFSWRFVSDQTEHPELEESVLDETHLLDIDSTRSSGTRYASIGGGEYELPINGAYAYKLRNYLEYDEEGMAVVVDFRLVSLLKEGER